MSMISGYLSNNVGTGMGDAVETVENVFCYGKTEFLEEFGIILDSTTVDAGNTPTTALRAGLVLGRIGATKRFKQYDPAATDGSQIPVCFLRYGLSMYDLSTGAAREMQARGLFSRTNIITANCQGFDENVRRQLSSKFTWDDFRQIAAFPSVVEAKTGNYTITSSDNGKQFTNRGAAGAVNFTLPATIVRGFRVRVSVEADQNVVVTAGSGLLVAFNNPAATSVAFQTTGQKVGGSFEIISNDNASKYIAIPSGSNTVTVA